MQSREQAADQLKNNAATVTVAQSKDHGHGRANSDCILAAWHVPASVLSGHWGNFFA